jgi:hypothetical protein
LLCGVAFLYRGYLGWASGRLAATGAREEALFTLLVDPLWRAEFAVATALGDPGNLGLMNLLGVASWGAFFLASAAVALRTLRGRRTKG